MRTLSQKSRYALEALELLAREEGKGPVLISGVVEREGLPRKFLEHILLQLKNHGLLQSKRGKGGGYFLRKPAKEITVGEVVRIFDGHLAPLPCASDMAFVKCGECEDVATCSTRAVMREVRDAIAKVLDATTVADLITRSDSMKTTQRATPMYHI